MNHILLKQVPLFNDLPEHVLEQIAACMAMIEFPESTVIIREGESGDDFYVVLSGQIEVIKALGTPDERLLALRGVGEFVGELSLVNPDGLRTASVRTLGSTWLWRMAHQDFDALLQQHSDLALQTIRALGERLTYAHNMTIQDLHEKNVQLQNAYLELKEAHEQIVEKKRLERELQLAREIQQSILPDVLPKVSGYDFGAIMSPARAVGGDFFDVFLLGKERVGVVIGDVADKGIPSAIFMAQTHAMIYTEATRCKSPTEVLTRVNRHLMRMGTSKLFVTVLYGILDRRKNEFVYARAGHEIPLLLANGHPIEFVQWAKGQPLGMFEHPTLDQQVLPLNPGSTVLFYTDGLADCRNLAGEFFGMERVKTLLPTLQHLQAPKICEQMWEHLSDFQQGAAQDDDVTMVVLSSP